jgi:PAS domain S-box-containing protein
VAEATDGVEALQVLERNGADAIISDILMPRMDGYRLCSEVRKRKEFEHVPFIHYTATYTASSDEKLSADLGADVFLRKPATAGDILSALRRVTDKGHTAHTVSAIPELDVMREYSERLVAKLEYKTLELERTLEDLMSERARLGHFLEQSPAVIYALKIDGETVTPVVVSENIERLLGVSVAESTRYQWWLNSLHPEDRDRVAALLTKSLTEGGYSTEYRIQHKDGSYHWVEDNNRVVHDEAGHPIESVGAWTDITERKRAEKVLLDVSSEKSGRRKKKICRDSLVVLGLTILTFAVENYFNLFQQAFVVLSDQAKYPLADEAFGTLIFFTLALMIFSYRRWKESAGEIASQKHLVEALRVLHDELDHRVQQRTAELATSNDSLRDKVAEQERAGEVLRESERRFREMLENVELLAMTLGKDGTVTFCNDSLLRVTGWKREEVIGTNWFAKFIPDANLEVKKVFFDTIEVGEIPARYENPIKTRTGELRQIVWNNTTLRDIAGNIIGTASLGEDVTDRRQQEERTREQADIINRAQDAIIVLNLEDHRITFWNSGAERLYGWTENEAIGRRMGELLYVDEKDREAPLQILLSTGEFRGELKQVMKDGREVIVDGRCTIVRNPDGTPRSILSINTDITEQKKLETQLLRSQRLESIGTLASGVAHDLNNILTPILVGSQILHETVPKESQSLLSLMEESARRGVNIVKQVLTFARGIEGERVVIDPKHLIQEMRDIAYQTFPKSIEIKTQYPEEVWSIQSDPTQLHQVLLNLSVNARDAMPNGGSMTIGANNFNVDEHYASMTPGAHPGPHVVLRVSDTGIGMPRATIDKIFDPFFTTKEVGKGTGLGLSTVLGIVKSHNGFISVYSEIGNGTTFKIFLPATITEQSSRKSGISPKTFSGNGELVLIVDDEPGILRVTKIILEKHNYRVLEANDAPEALALFAQHMDSVNLVLSDIMMPYMDGVMLVRAIKKMKPAMKFIASTGQGEETRTQELETLQVTNFLTKPYDTEHFLKTLHDTLTVQPSGLSQPS